MQRRIGTAAVDVLPVETALVKANGVRWSPLPVFQAYCAYTPALDALNRDELVRAGAPFVLYRYEAIDGRLPFGDMPATTAELLCRYDVALPQATTAGGDRFMLLTRSARRLVRRGAGRPAPPLPRSATPSPYRPRRPARSSRRRSRCGPASPTRIASALWRAPAVALELRFGDGTVRRYRAVTATLRDGVVVSAAPLDEAEAARFLGGARGPGRQQRGRDRAARRVRARRRDVHSPHALARAGAAAMKPTPAAAVGAIVGVALAACVVTLALVRPDPLPRAAGATWAAQARNWGTATAGRSYAIEGAPRSDRAIPRGTPFEISGWAIDPKLLRTADHVVYAVDGGGWRFAAYNEQRADVMQRLHLPAADCGFRARIDTSALAPGTHTVTLATESGGDYTTIPERIVVRVSAR